MLFFYKIWEKYNEIYYTKANMALNNLKIKKHPPSTALVAAGGLVWVITQCIAATLL